MNSLRAIVLGIAIFGVTSSLALAAPNGSKGKPIALDSRIKTYIYSENEVFRLVVHFGYQTSIEFADGEEIQMISVGNNYAWQITPVGRRLFIKPLEDNIATNMTIITNRRTYQFDIESRPLTYSSDEELVYVVRFFFPDSDFDMTRPQISAVEAEPIPVVKPFNFCYTLTGPDKVAPIKIFDDGVNTFFKFPECAEVPKFEIIESGVATPQTPRRKGEYIILNSIAHHYRLKFKGNQVVDVFNEKMVSGN
jgi:type IV secretion system protein VirB9